MLFDELFCTNSLYLCALPVNNLHNALKKTSRDSSRDNKTF